jgi:ATP-dependent Lon protease
MAADPKKSRTEADPDLSTVRRASEEESMPTVLPVLPLGDVVVFPGMIAPLVVNTARSIKLVEETVAGSRFLIAALQRNSTQSDDVVNLGDLHPTGCITRVLKMLRFPDDTVRVLVQGVSRCQIKEPEVASPYLRCTYAVLADQIEDTIELAALGRSATQVFTDIITLSPTLPDELKIAVVNTEDSGRLADLLAANLNLSLEDRQALLAEPRARARLEKLSPLLNREREVLRVGTEIQNQVHQTFSKNQREFFLREQIKAIRKELGESDPTMADASDLDARIAKAKMPPEVEKVARKERERMQAVPTASPEYGVIRTYLDLLCELPWTVTTEDHLDIKRARVILDEDHYDLKAVKDRILEYLSVLKLKRDMKGPILCFVGPPGVGKTSLGQSIARALGRKFVRMSLGGMRDEAEIRGHRRTYIGSMPGRIIQSLRKSGTRNPVFMLDEIDKLGTDSAATPPPPCWRCSTPPRTIPSPTTIWMCPSTFPPCCSLPPETSSTPCPVPCATAWKSSSCPAIRRTKNSRLRSAT